MTKKVQPMSAKSMMDEGRIIDLKDIERLKTLLRKATKEKDAESMAELAKLAFLGASVQYAVMEGAVPDLTYTSFAVREAVEMVPELLK